jgi:quercetin dioxygenase-like cupin family protein
MKIFNLKDEKQLEPVPGYRVKFVHSEHMTFAFWDILEGYTVPQHSHPNEQVIKMLEGKLKMILNGTEFILEKDDVMVIPAGVEHGAYSLTDCLTIDTFHPVREDYKNL